MSAPSPQSMVGTAAAADPPAPPEMPAIARARQGYHPGQIHQYVSVLLDRIHELEGFVKHGAEEGATVAVRAAKSPEGEALLADLMKMATDEITGQKAAAAAEAADLLRRAGEDADAKLRGATSQATSIVAGAEEEAQKLVVGARTQADTVLATARSQAKETVDRASAHAAAVDEGAARRLGSMSDLHGETRRRLQEIHDVTGQVLSADEERGSLQDEVTRATVALADHQAPAPLPAIGRLPLPPAEMTAQES